MKNVAIVGAGDVGGYFGGKLCQLLGEDSNLNMTLIARGAHLAAIQEKGLILNTEKEGQLLCVPTITTDSLESLESVDLVLLCVKEFPFFLSNSLNFTLFLKNSWSHGFLNKKSASFPRYLLSVENFFLAFLNIIELV